MSGRLVRPLLLGLSLTAFALTPPVRNRILDRFIFQPVRGVDFTPAQLGIHAEEIWLRSEDGVRLHAFWLPAPGATRAILMLHGNAGNASHRLPRAAALAALGAHVLLPDYRGYGLSDGSPGETALADARAALAKLVVERGIDAARVVLFGHSLGGAIAVDLAADRKLAGVVLESTFTSLADVARASRVRSAAGSCAGASTRFEDRAARAPLLQLHGDATPWCFRVGCALFDAARSRSASRPCARRHNDTRSSAAAATDACSASSTRSRRFERA